jgi:hypothetical protein
MNYDQILETWLRWLGKPLESALQGGLEKEDLIELISQAYQEGIADDRDEQFYGSDGRR